MLISFVFSLSYSVARARTGLTRVRRGSVESISARTRAARLVETLALQSSEGCLLRTRGQLPDEKIQPPIDHDYVNELIYFAKILSRQHEFRPSKVALRVERAKQTVSRTSRLFVCRHRKGVGRARMTRIDPSDSSAQIPLSALARQSDRPTLGL